MACNCIALLGVTRDSMQLYHTLPSLPITFPSDRTTNWQSLMQLHGKAKNTRKNILSRYNYVYLYNMSCVCSRALTSQSLELGRVDYQEILGVRDHLLLTEMLGLSQHVDLYTYQQHYNTNHKGVFSLKNKKNMLHRENTSR